MRIGLFKPARGDSYSGNIRTLTLDHPRVMFHAVDEKRANGPDYIVSTYPHEASDPSEIGAAWKRTDKAGNEYLSVKLDSPELPSPINAALVMAVEDDTDMNLVWSRTQKA